MIYCNIITKSSLIAIHPHPIPHFCDMHNIEKSRERVNTDKVKGKQRWEKGEKGQDKGEKKWQKEDKGSG